MPHVKGLIKNIRKKIEPQSAEQWLKFITFLAVAIPAVTEMVEQRYSVIWVLLIILLSKKIKPKVLEMEQKYYGYIQRQK